MADEVDSLGQCFSRGIAKNDDEEKIIQLIKGLGDVNIKFKGTPLVILYFKNSSWVSWKIVHAFEEAGVDWNVRDENQNTSLHLLIATRVNRYYELHTIVTVMVRSGADATLVNSSGDNVVAAAIKRGHQDAVVWLIVR